MTKQDFAAPAAGASLTGHNSFKTRTCRQQGTRRMSASPNRTRMAAACAALTLCAVSVLGAAPAKPIQAGRIMVGAQATALETYAARELQKYLYAISDTLLPIVSDDGAAIDRNGPGALDQEVGATPARCR